MGIQETQLQPGARTVLDLCAPFVDHRRDSDSTAQQHRRKRALRRKFLSRRRQLSAHLGRERTSQCCIQMNPDAHSRQGTQPTHPLLECGTVSHNTRRRNDARFGAVQDSARHFIEISEIVGIHDHSNRGFCCHRISHALNVPEEFAVTFRVTAPVSGQETRSAPARLPPDCITKYGLWCYSKMPRDSSAPPCNSEDWPLSQILGLPARMT